MIYSLYGTEITIHAMQRPKFHHGSSVEFIGDESLKKIGLNEKFYFKAPDHFSNDGPIETQANDTWPRNREQSLLAEFLRNNIAHGKLAKQYDWFFHQY